MNDDLNGNQRIVESQDTTGKSSEKKKAASTLEQFQVMALKQFKGGGTLLVWHVHQLDTY